MSSTKDDFYDFFISMGKRHKRSHDSATSYSDSLALEVALGELAHIVARCHGFAIGSC